MNHDRTKLFIHSAASSNKMNVLMTFYFPESCDWTIQLYALSNKLPSLPDFEDEREVLLFLMTVFRVT